MSQEAAKALVEKLKTDEEFRKKIMGVEDLKQRINLVNEEGFDVTEDEIRQEWQALSEEELKNVFGGVGSPGSRWGEGLCWKCWRRGAR
ncbi:MAG: Nif11-like leader peptide family natural product precursor [Desulfobacteraceae bacterium]|nr:Nif11-like leader peptide family natural product precursor [Desulfobacteraceae bacterium]